MSESPSRPQHDEVRSDARAQRVRSGSRKTKQRTGALVIAGLLLSLATLLHGRGPDPTGTTSTTCQALVPLIIDQRHHAAFGRANTQTITDVTTQSDRQDDYRTGTVSPPSGSTPYVQVLTCHGTAHEEGGRAHPISFFREYDDVGHSSLGSVDAKS